MTTQSVKGLLKGLRYISQIFDEKEEERSIEIGFPTDVKHVAHIGSDGPSNSQPTWMNEFSDASKTQQKQPTQTQAPEPSTQGNMQQNNNSEALDSPTKSRKSNKKQSRRRTSSSDGGLLLETASSEPNSNPTTTTNKPRRNKNSGAESPARDSTTARAPKASTNRKKTGSDKLPRPKKSSGHRSSDVTNEMTMELGVEEGDDDNEYGDRANNKRAL